MVLSVAAVLPILWAFTLSLHFARPYVLRFLQKLTLRFGGDVWWLSYVLTRDALLVITLCLSVVFLFPNVYLRGDGPADHGPARDARPVLGDARQAAPRPGRRPGRLPAAERPAGRRLGPLHRPAGVRHGGRGPDEPRRPAERCSSAPATSPLAQPILWITLALFGITGGALFVRFLLKLGKPQTGKRRPSAVAGRAACRRELRHHRRRRRAPRRRSSGRGVRPIARIRSPMIRAMCEQFIARAAEPFRLDELWPLTERLERYGLAGFGWGVTWLAAGGRPADPPGHGRFRDDPERERSAPSRPPACSSTSAARRGCRRCSCPTRSRSSIRQAGSPSRTTAICATTGRHAPGTGARAASTAAPTARSASAGSRTPGPTRSPWATCSARCTTRSAARRTSRCWRATARPPLRRQPREPGVHVPARLDRPRVHGDLLRGPVAVPVRGERRHGRRLVRLHSNGGAR